MNRIANRCPSRMHLATTGSTRHNANPTDPGTWTGQREWVERADATRALRVCRAGPASARGDDIRQTHEGDDQVADEALIGPLRLQIGQRIDSYPARDLRAAKRYRLRDDSRRGGHRDLVAIRWTHHVHSQVTASPSRLTSPPSRRSTRTTSPPASRRSSSIGPTRRRMAAAIRRDRRGRAAVPGHRTRRGRRRVRVLRAVEDAGPPTARPSRTRSTSHRRPRPGVWHRTAAAPSSTPAARRDQGGDRGDRRQRRPGVGELASALRLRRRRALTRVGFKHDRYIDTFCCSAL